MPEKTEQDWGLRWWVRYAFIPIAVATIAGVSAIVAADSFTEKPTSTATLPYAITLTPTGTATSDPPNGPGGTPTNTPTATFSATPTASPTTTPTPTAVTVGEHVVRRGETLYCIGRAYGVQPNTIAQANRLVAPFNLHPGQVLNIPAAPWAVVPRGPTCPPQFSSPFGATPTPTTPAPTLGSYVGLWRNVDAATQRWAAIQITQKANTLIAQFERACDYYVQACQPLIASTVYVGNPVYMYLDGKAAVVSFTLSLTGNTLHVTTRAHFIDGSGQGDYISEDDFRQ